ncbi:MAG: TIGR03862 family flavoprotein [Rhodocyclaceae bacterium]|nr:TIGR03862 family flavoprotein [Rhodocyclaceae bacterium]
MSSTPESAHPRVAIIGGGPAGLMAAEVLSQGGAAVDVYDAMPTLGRKFLLAGRGGLNITHSEALPSFLARYGARRERLEAAIQDFGPEALRAWVHELGVETFVGSSGRVFPAQMKAAPLLRAWLHRLRQGGVSIHTRHRWQGWTPDGALSFNTREGEREVHADAVILALGGGSWAKLGSDGAWIPWLEARGIRVAPLAPANCGFEVAAWSEHFRRNFAGQPLKSVSACWTDNEGREHRRRGEFLVTDQGLEGSLIYALSAPLRDAIAAQGEAILRLDLLPDFSPEKVLAEVSHPRGSRSQSSHLQSRLGLKGVKMGLLRELLSREDFSQPSRLAAAIKALPLALIRPRPLDEAISSAGGVAFEGLDEHLMVKATPGLFCAGEMLDWEAPTGGYLLTACLATGRAAGLGALRWLTRRQPEDLIGEIFQAH